MKLRFYAKDDLLVTVPDAQPYVSQALPRVGRNPDGSPSEEPYECDDDSPEGRRLIQLMRREAPLQPADEETAAACGVEFVEPVPAKTVRAGKPTAFALQISARR